MKLSILQWNVWYKENPDHIIKQINILNPDIVCAQELVQNSQLSKKIDTAKYIANKIGYHLVSKIAETWDNKKDKTSQSNGIFSKLPIIKNSFEYIKKPRHNPINAAYEGRVYIEVKVKAGSKILTIGTTHLSYSDHFKLNSSRKAETDNLIKILKKHIKNYIFTGDLNSVPSSYTIKSIGQYFRNAGPDFEEKTWTTKSFDYHGFKETDLKWRLDYVFTTKDIKVIAASIINSPYSDHLPVLVEVEI